MEDLAGDVDEGVVELDVVAGFDAFEEVAVELVGGHAEGAHGRPRLGGVGGWGKG